jgi:glycosyltransferase involved in cell wall biosynthesis
VPGLRVAVDVTPLLGVRSGVARTVTHLLDALPGAAPDVEVVPYVLSRRAEGSSLPRGARALPTSAAVAIRLWGWVDRPAVARALGDVDVVHGTNFVVPPTASAARTVTIHDTWCLRRPRSCPPNVRPFRRAVGRALATGAWAHVSTEAVDAEVHALYGDVRTWVAPFGVPPLAEPGTVPSPVEGTRFVLAVGTLEPRKRIDHLVAAFAIVAEDDADLRLVLAGADGPAGGDVERAIDALPAAVQSRVHRLGHVDEPTRAALLLAAEVLAYPSADEGFGFPVLESMAAGTPVVATAVGGIPEVAGDAALLVPLSDDPAPLAAALRSARERREELVARGRARAAQFSWHEHAAGMAELWRRAAAR